MFGLITKKYHNQKIESLKNDFDKKLSDVTLSLSKNDGTRAFNMAKVDRLTADWLAYVRDFNYDLKVGGKNLIARARELYQNDPYAKKLVAEKRKGIVGPKGFILRNNAGEFGLQNGSYKFIKDKIANGIINEQWYQYSKNNYITIEGDETLRSHCGTLIDSVMIDGEIFIKKLPGPKYNPFGFTTQIITSENCDWTLNKELPNGNFIIMGIEVNREWKKIAYWFRKTTPKHSVDFGLSWTSKYERIEADKIIHLYVKEFTHQLRGVTLLAPVGIRLRMLYQFEESSLFRANISARVPGMIERIPQTLGAPGPGIDATQKDSNDDWIMQLANGEFLKVKDGYQVKNLESDFPHQLQGDFQKHMLRSISAGGDIGFSTLSNNYESVTWHSGKLEKQSERDAYIEGQSWFIENYLNHIYGDPMCWLEMAALAGKFKFPSGKDLPVLEKIEKFNQPFFYGRSWEYTNPKEEREANIMAVQSFQKTFEQVLAEQGNDLEEQLDDIAAERQLFKDRGLGDLYEMLMTKYNSSPAETSAQKDSKNNSNNGNGKQHFVRIEQ